MFKSGVVIGAGLGMVILGTQTVRADQYQDLAKSLAELRSEVESRSGKLADMKGDLQDEIRTLARQKSELSLELDREQMNLQKLRATIAQKKEAVDKEKAKAKALLPVFEQAVKRARAYIESSLPFRTEERLAEVKKVEEQLHAGLLTPQKAVARIWAVMEDEFRMTRDSGLFRQTVAIDGKEQLADVVRIGMVMLYYRTSEGEVGYVSNEDGKWTFKPITGPDDAKLVEALFDSFKKQIRQGYFEIPNALATRVTQ